VAGARAQTGLHSMAQATQTWAPLVIDPWGTWCWLTRWRCRLGWPCTRSITSMGQRVRASCTSLKPAVCLLAVLSLRMFIDPTAWANWPRILLGGVAPLRTPAGPPCRQKPRERAGAWRIARDGRRVGGWRTSPFISLKWRLWAGKGGVPETRIWNADLLVPQPQPQPIRGTGPSKENPDRQNRSQQRITRLVWNFLPGPPSLNRAICGWSGTSP